MTADGPTQRNALDAFSRALGREAHNLTGRPELLWQQLHNRLQWGEEPVPSFLEAERVRRSSACGSPWMRTRTPFPESTSLLRTLEGHAGPVEACAVSPDGALIASASSDRTLKIWNPLTGECLRTLKGHAHLTCVAFSPDGHLLVSGDWDSLLKIWDLSSGACLRTLEGHAEWIHSCAVSPDWGYVVSASGDKTLRVWDPESGECLSTLEGHTRDVNSCAVSPNAAYVVSAAGGEGGEVDPAETDRTVRIWDPITGECLRTLRGHRFGVTGCAFSRDGTRVISVSGDEMIKVWDAASGECVQTVTGAIMFCAVTPDGARVLAGHRMPDEALELRDLATGEHIRTFRGHAKFVTAGAVSPDGTYAVSASYDGTLKVWDMAIEGSDVPGDGHGYRVMSCAMSPDGTYSVSAGKGLKLWNEDSGEHLRDLEGHRSVVNGCAVGSIGAPVVSASRDRSVKLWDPRTGECTHTLRGHRNPVVACAVCPGGDAVVSAAGGADPGASEDSPWEIRLWDPGSAACTWSAFAHAERITALAASPDGTYVLSASFDKTIKLWDRTSGDCLRTLEGHGDAITACTLSPDGAHVVSASGDKTVKVWDPTSGECLRTLRCGGGISGCAVTPDGRLVATVENRDLKFWDTDAWSEMAVIPLLGDMRCVAVHPWLPRAVCGDVGGRVYLIDLVGIEYGPIIVTAFERGDGPAVRCPACWREHPVEEGWLGEVIDCPTAACELRLRLNPFLISG